MGIFSEITTICHLYLFLFFSLFTKNVFSNNFLSPKFNSIKYEINSNGLSYPLPSNIYNVVENCNAVGDGTTDDTESFQNCTSMLSETGGVLTIPPGSYLISDTIKIPQTSYNMEIMGYGWTSTLVWSKDVDLIQFTCVLLSFKILINSSNFSQKNQCLAFCFRCFSSLGPVNQLTVRDLKIFSTQIPKSTTAISFPGGLVKSLLDHILFIGDDSQGAYKLSSL